LRQDIERRIKVYVPDSPLSVLVLKIAVPRFTWLEGSQTRGVYHGSTDEGDAGVAMAGGMTTFAKEDDIPGHLEEEGGKPKTYSIRLWPSRGRKRSRQEHRAQDRGDTIVVP